MGRFGSTRHFGGGTAMKSASMALAIAVGLTACGSGGGSSVEQSTAPNPTINFFSNPDISGATQNAVDRCNAAAKGRYTISYQLLPNDSDSQRQQLTQRLSVHDPAIDLMAMDVNWTAEFALQGWVKEWTGDAKSQVTNGTLQGALATATYNNKLYGAPFNTNTQLLWYRKDLVPNPPKTWDDMIDQAQELAKQNKPHLVEVQGARYEGLTVWFDSLVSSAGGSILSTDAKRANTGPATQRAAEIMKKLATSTAADPSLANTQEDQARLAFEQGTAAFEVNYPFVYPSAKENVPDVAKNMAWAPFPGVTSGQPPKVTIGGINLGVSAYSKNVDNAQQAAQCLRNADNQKLLATEGGLPPTLTALYDEPSVRDTYPFADEIRAQLNNASVRPQTSAYSAMSLAIQDILSPPSAIDTTSVNAALGAAINNALTFK